MKLTTTILILFVCFGCRDQPYNAQLNGYVTIENPDKSNGFDSLMIFADYHNKINVAFCHFNNLRFKKDTVYTKDTAYREWGRVWQIAPDVMLATKHGATIFIGNGFRDMRKSYWDSIVVNGYQIKVKPQSK